MSIDITYNRLATQLLRNLNTIGDEDTEGDAVTKQVDLILSAFSEVLRLHETTLQQPAPTEDNELGEIG